MNVITRMLLSTSQACLISGQFLFFPSQNPAKEPWCQGRGGTILNTILHYQSLTIWTALRVYISGDLVTLSYVNLIYWNINIPLPAHNWNISPTLFLQMSRQLRLDKRNCIMMAWWHIEISPVISYSCRQPNLTYRPGQVYNFITVLDELFPWWCGQISGLCCTRTISLGFLSRQ